MQPIAIVVALDEGLKVRAEVIEISIGVGVDLFPLECLHEALTTGVVIGVGRPAHARDHVVRSQPNDWHVLMFQHQAKNTIQLMGEWQDSMGATGSASR